MEKPPTTPPPEVPFVNEVRLNWKNWLVVFGLLVVIIWATPRVWKRFETAQFISDFRVPYHLSKDYWLYRRLIEETPRDQRVLVIGDSVVWGEYVAPDGTLTHFLNKRGPADRFVNAGVNGLYPLAIEGLIANYAPLKKRKVILHCNLLWMSSPKADLQENKAQQINHARLLPQFHKIPSYRADANERLSVLVERNVQFMSWVTHLQVNYFTNKSIPQWTLLDDGNEPPQYPNAYKNPLKQISMRVPNPLWNDPERGTNSPRHKAWTETGATPTHFDWVPLEQSLQWAAFARTLETLRARGNDVFVVVGPFNEHIIADDSKAAFVKLRDGVVSYLKIQGTPFAAPEVLPSELYADGSHPLTLGYSALAFRLHGDTNFFEWLRK